jgi:hypothetical protein
MGDLNGDGSADLLLATPYYNFDADGRAVITGGAFKLVY